MSPQPIDAQSMIGRMAVADQAQHAAERQPVVQQERLAIQAPAESAHKQTQVQQPEETEQERVRDKQRRKEPFSGKRRSRKKRPRRKDATQEDQVVPEPSTYSPPTGKGAAADDKGGSVLDLKA